MAGPTAKPKPKMTREQRLWDADLVEETFHLKRRYGTADRYLMALLSNVMPFQFANPIAESYREFVEADTAANTTEVRPRLPEARGLANINDIILLEMRGLIGARA